MITLETLSVYMLFFVLAPLFGAFTILFIAIFERKFEALQKEAQRHNLEKQLEKSKYELLSQQIQPHFFFNTLNVILSLARLDRKDELIFSIETLSRFLKHKYKDTNYLSTIQEEMQFTSYYLSIQELRFGNRLNINKDIDPSVLDEKIPSYLIQTLVENCFKHAFEKIQDDVYLMIKIENRKHHLYLEVKNSHQLDQKEISLSFDGLGLQNIYERLKLIYSAPQVNLNFDHQIEWTVVSITWPSEGEPDEYTSSRR